jgi:hypothetical protein
MYNYVAEALPGYVVSVKVCILEGSMQVLLLKK